MVELSTGFLQASAPAATLALPRSRVACTLWTILPNHEVAALVSPTAQMARPRPEVCVADCHTADGTELGARLHS